jgi:WhiB family redox-sensing transcriptional regulator
MSEKEREALAAVLADLTDTAPLVPAPDWTAALCAQVDPDLWFPDKGGSTRVPKQICAGCPIKAECLAWAIATDERYGVWGGLSEKERRALKRRQQVAALSTDEQTRSTHVQEQVTMGVNGGFTGCSDGSWPTLSGGSGGESWAA